MTVHVPLDIQSANCSYTLSLFALIIASFELEGIVSSSIVTLSSDTRTMSGLAVELDK